MRTGEIWREAVRNFRSGASRGGIGMLAFLVIVVGFGGVATRDVVSVSSEAAAYRDAGASVYRLDAPDGIDGAACDRLATIEGVDAAGATRAGEPIRFALLPDLPTPYFDTTAGMSELLGASTSESGLILDRGLAESLGIAHLPTTTFVAGESTETSVAAEYQHPDDGRDATLSGAALGVSVPDGGAFDACWVRFWPPTDDPLELMAAVETASGGTGQASQWNSTLGRTYDPRSAFLALPTNALGTAAAILAAALAYVGVRMRRLELASARHVGVDRPSLVGICLAETTIWWVPATLFAATVLALAAVWINPDPPIAAWSAGARIVGAASAAWFLTVGAATASIRETHLVRYFQQR